MMTSTSKAEVGSVLDVRPIDSIDRGWIIFKVDYWKKYMNGMRNFCYIEINSFVWRYLIGEKELRLTSM